MVPGSDPEVLLASSFVLGDGLRVRLRLARSTDARAIQRLIGDPAIDRDPQGVGPLVHYDPRRRCVLCASTLVGSTEKLVGVGAVDLDREQPAGPQTLIVDREHGPELAELLEAALMARVRLAARARAA
jgi:hypothetical protein